MNILKKVFSISLLSTILAMAIAPAQAADITRLH